MEEEKLFASDDFSALLQGNPIKNVRLIEKNVKHVLSHRVIHANCYEVTLEADGCELPGYLRVRVDDLHKFPVSRLVSRFFSLILNQNR